MLLIVTFCSILAVCGSVKLSDVTNEVFRGNNIGVVAAFGNFNDDKIVDIYLITGNGSPSGNGIQVLIGSENGAYKAQDLNIETSNSTIISGVVPADFNGDAFMDLLVCRVPARHSGEPNFTSMEVYWGKTDSSGLSDATHLPDTYRDQPLLFDYNADMLPDLLIEYPNGTRKVWLSSEDSNFTLVPFSKDNQDTTVPFHFPQSNAFQDLNGDFAADLILTTENGLELWINEGPGLAYNQSIPYPDNTPIQGQLALADVDEDGEIDFLLPACHNEDCSNSSIFVYKDGKWTIIYADFTFEDSTWGFVVPEAESAMENFPITLRVGSYDMDGYADLIVNLRTKNRDGEWVMKAFILENIGCSSGSCQNIGRTFRIVDRSPIQNIDNVVLAVFFDLYEDGILDILIVSYPGDGKPLEVNAFLQTPTKDAYFMKVMVLSGRCYRDCPLYGVNQPGPVVEYDTTNLNGKHQIGSGGQLSQSAHFSLQLPYVLFGLGQTPNFIDLVEVGIPRNGPERSREWTQIIPNSQLFVIPHPPDRPPKWVLKMFVTPSQRVLLTGVALLGFMLFVSILVGILHWMERREDMKEKRQDAHKFHFDAM